MSLHLGKYNLDDTDLNDLNGFQEKGEKAKMKETVLKQYKKQIDQD